MVLIHVYHMQTGGLQKASEQGGHMHRQRRERTNDITTTAAITHYPERKHDSEPGHVTGSWGKAGLSWQPEADLNSGLNIWANTDLVHLFGEFLYITAWTLVWLVYFLWFHFRLSSTSCILMQWCKQEQVWLIAAGRVASSSRLRHN